MSFRYFFYIALFCYGCNLFGAHDWDQFIGCYEGLNNKNATMSVSYSDQDRFWTSTEEEGMPLKSYSIEIFGVENGVGTISSAFINSNYATFFRNPEDENEYHYNFSGKAIFLGESIWKFSKHSSFTINEDETLYFENHTYLFSNGYPEVHKFDAKIKFKRTSQLPCNLR
ncbi:MAG: hypothetical protein R3B45_10805 [Bdellovibrionota bacterium]